MSNYNHGRVGKRIVTISGFTEYKIVKDESNDIIICRACPTYRCGLDWFDWATIDWEEESCLLPAQLLIFLDMNTLEFENCIDEDNIEPHDIIEHEMCVLIHSVANNSSSYSRAPAKINESLLNHERGPISKLSKFCDMEDSYQLINIECVTGECFVLIDSLNGNVSKSKVGNVKSVITVTSQKLWHLSFIDYNSQALLDVAARRVDDTIEENDKRYMYES